jgi:hypothetical protein
MPQSRHLPRTAKGRDPSMDAGGVRVGSKRVVLTSPVSVGKMERSTPLGQAFTSEKTAHPS